MAAGASLGSAVIAYPTNYPFELFGPRELTNRRLLFAGDRTSPGSPRPSSVGVFFAV